MQKVDTRLQFQDRQILDRKYSAPPFGKLNEILLSAAADNLLIKIYVITGWKLPENEMLQDELARQLSYKLKESYPTCNVNEVEYAFRSYGPEVKDWGKNLNLSLVDEVMSSYMEARVEVSRIEEHLNKPKMIFNNSVTTQAEKLEDIERWENETNPNIDLIPPFIFDYLIEFEKINPSAKDKWDAMNRAALHRKSQLYDEMENGNTKAIQDYNEFLNMFSTKVYEDSVFNRLKLLAKKIMVFDYLKKLSDAK